MKKKQGELIGKIKRRYPGVIILSMLLITLLLTSCTQKEGSKAEESSETTSQQQNEVITKNNIKEKNTLIQKESGEMMNNDSVMNNDSTMMDNQEMNTNSMMNETRIIKVDAKKWEYSKKIIRVKKGEKVIIRINNTDVLHGIAIPGMKLVGNDEVTLDTSKTGTFEFRCANYCGSGHSTMEGKIIVE